MSFKRINELLKIEKVATLHNIGLRVYLKITHDSETMEFYLTENEINTMYEVLHEGD